MLASDVFLLFSVVAARFRQARAVLQEGCRQFLYGLPDFTSDLVMCLVGLRLASYVLPSKLIFGLCHPEQIGRQLSAAHVVEYMLRGLEAFALLYIAALEATVQPHVTMVCEYSEIEWLYNPCEVGSLGEPAIVDGDFATQVEPSLILGKAGELVCDSSACSCRRVCTAK